MNKLWENMTDTERRRLLQYKKYLIEDSPVEVDQGDMLDLAKYCTENDLCITEIPNRKRFGDDMLHQAKQMHPFSFMEMYQDELFVDENDTPVNLKQILKENNQYAELTDILIKRDGKTVKVIDRTNTKEYSQKCTYLAEQCDLPEYMGELILSEIKNGDKSMPHVVNTAVNIGLLPIEYYIEQTE